jgi:hypothetical protein
MDTAAMTLTLKNAIRPDLEVTSLRSWSFDPFELAHNPRIAMFELSLFSNVSATVTGRSRKINGQSYMYLVRPLFEKRCPLN